MIYGGYYCLWCHPHWLRGHMLQEDNSRTMCCNSISKGQDKLSRNLVSHMSHFWGRYICYKELRVFFDLYPCSENRNYIHPLVLLHTQSSASIEQKTSFPKKVLFHQSSYFLGMHQGKIICKCITLYPGNIPLVNFYQPAKRACWYLLCREEICAYFPPKICKGTVVVFCMRCGIFGQCQHEILLLDKTSGN